MHNVSYAHTLLHLIDKHCAGLIIHSLVVSNSNYIFITPYGSKIQFVYMHILRKKSLPA